MSTFFSLLQSFQERFSSFNPRQRVSTIITIVALVALPVTLIALKYQQNIRSKAVEPPIGTTFADGRLRILQTNRQNNEWGSTVNENTPARSAIVKLVIDLPNWDLSGSSEQQGLQNNQTKTIANVSTRSVLQAASGPGCADSVGTRHGVSGQCEKDSFSETCWNTQENKLNDTPNCANLSNSCNNVNAYYYTTCTIGSFPSLQPTVIQKSPACADENGVMRSANNQEIGKCTEGTWQGQQASYDNCYGPLDPNDPSGTKIIKNGRNANINSIYWWDNCPLASSAGSPGNEVITACADNLGNIWNNKTGTKTPFTCSGKYRGDNDSAQFCFDKTESKVSTNPRPYASGYNAYLFEGCPVIEQQAGVGACCNTGLPVNNQPQCGSATACVPCSQTNCPVECSSLGNNAGVCGSGSGSGGGSPGGGFGGPSQPTVTPRGGTGSIGTKDRGQACIYTNECTGGFVCGSAYGSDVPTAKCVEVVDRATFGSAGSQCHSSLECIDDYVCKPLTDTSPATCEIRTRFNNIITRGRNCGLEQNNCDQNLQCRDYDNTKVCLTYRNVPEGQFCYDSDECHQGLTCKKDPNKKNMGICTKNSQRFTKFFRISNKGDFSNSDNYVEFPFNEQDGASGKAFVVPAYAISPNDGEVTNIQIRFYDSSTGVTPQKYRQTSANVKLVYDKLLQDAGIIDEDNKALQVAKNMEKDLGNRVTFTQVKYDENEEITPEDEAEGSWDGIEIGDEASFFDYHELNEKITIDNQSDFYFSLADLKILAYHLVHNFKINPYFALCQYFDPSDPEQQARLASALWKYSALVGVQVSKDELYPKYAYLPLPCDLANAPDSELQMFPRLKDVATRFPLHTITTDEKRIQRRDAIKEALESGTYSLLKGYKFVSPATAIERDGYQKRLSITLQTAQVLLAGTPRAQLFSVLAEDRVQRIGNIIPHLPIAIGPPVALEQIENQMNILGWFYIGPEHYQECFDLFTMGAPELQIVEECAPLVLINVIEGYAIGKGIEFAAPALSPVAQEGWRGVERFGNMLTEGGKRAVIFSARGYIAIGGRIPVKTVRDWVRESIRKKSGRFLEMIRVSRRAAAEVEKIAQKDFFNKRYRHGSDFPIISYHTLDDRTFYGVNYRNIRQPVRVWNGPYDDNNGISQEGIKGIEKELGIVMEDFNNFLAGAYDIAKKYGDRNLENAIVAFWRNLRYFTPDDLYEGLLYLAQAQVKMVAKEHKTVWNIVFESRSPLAMSVKMSQIFDRTLQGSRRLRNRIHFITIEDLQDPYRFSIIRSDMEKEIRNGRTPVLLMFDDNIGSGLKMQNEAPSDAILRYLPDSIEFGFSSVISNQAAQVGTRRGVVPQIYSYAAIKPSEDDYRRAFYNGYWTLNRAGFSQIILGDILGLQYKNGVLRPLQDRSGNYEGLWRYRETESLLRRIYPNSYPDITGLPLPEILRLQSPYNRKYLQRPGFVGDSDKDFNFIENQFADTQLQIELYDFVKKWMRFKIPVRDPSSGRTLP